jgi:adenylate kinase
MIILFGPAGAGKSVQGQILAARKGWRWLSAGQLLRDSRDPELAQIMSEGKLVPRERTNAIMGEAIDRAAEAGIEKIILDGFPRDLGQAEWLMEESNRPVAMVVVLEVPRDELLKRLELRGRVDDTPESIDERLSIYRKEMYPILNYLNEKGVAISHIDGVGNVGAIHDRIVAALESNGTKI